MTEKREWQGEWILRGENINEIKIIGTLKYEPTTGLVLYGTMKTIDVHTAFSVMLNTSKFHVTGIDYHTQKKITLNSCVLMNFSSSSNGGNSFKIVPTILVEGLSYSPKKPSKFRAIKFKYNFIDKWFDKENNIKFSLEQDNDAISVRYERPGNINIQINKHLKLRVIFGYSAKRQLDAKMGVFILHDASVRFDSTQLTALELLIRYGNYFNNLMQLICYQPCYVEECLAMQKDKNIIFPIYYNQHNSKYFNKYELNTMYLINYDEIDDFPKIVANWFDLKNIYSLKYVSSIASKYITMSGIFSEEIFLEIIRALEVYHKSIFPKKSKKEEENTSLRDRISFLLNELKNKVEHNVFCNFINDENNFIQTVVINRNYLTHYSEQYANSKYILSSPQLYKFTVKSKIILITLLLGYVGLNEKKVFDRLNSIHNAFDEIRNFS